MLNILVSCAPLQIVELVVALIAILVIDLGVRLGRRQTVKGSTDEAVH